MPQTITPSHSISPIKIQSSIEKLKEFEKSNKKLYKELMKLSVNGGFDAIYTEMKRREILQ